MILNTYQATLISQLEAYQPFDDTEATHLANMLAFLKSQTNPFARSTLEGHITASAVLIDDAYQQVALIWHEKIGRWFQPGGHCEPEDQTLPLAALRELVEETAVPEESITLLQETPFDLDVHLIPARGDEPEHWHYDVRYLFQTNAALMSQDATHQWQAYAMVVANPDPSRARFAAKLIKLA